MLAHQEDLLGAAAVYAHRVTQLSGDACRLLARLIMRTTACIRLDSLHYNEIAQPESALQELLDGGLVQQNAAVAAEQLLQRIKVDELKTLFPEYAGGKARKSDLLERILATYTDAHIRSRCAQQVPWLILDSERHLERVQLVYFGDLCRNLTEFVVRDLGISAFEPYELGASGRAFANDGEVSAYLDLAAVQRLPVYRRSAALDWLLQHPTMLSKDLANRSLLRRRDRLLNDWGRDFERTDQSPEAHRCYLSLQAILRENAGPGFLQKNQLRRNVRCCLTRCARHPGRCKSNCLHSASHQRAERNASLRWFGEKPSGQCRRRNFLMLSSARGSCLPATAGAPGIPKTLCCLLCWGCFSGIFCFARSRACSRIRFKVGLEIFTGQIFAADANRPSRRG